MLPGSRTVLKLLVLASFSAVLACSSTPDDNASSSRDAGLDVLAEATDVQIEAVEAEDVRVLDAQDSATEAEAPGPDAPISCEILADGSCSPAPDTSLGECNGCYRVTGQWYDVEGKCLYGGGTRVCTTVCFAFTQVQCYQREVGGTVEVMNLSSLFEDPRFEQETGLVPCGQALNAEVLSAPQCP